MVKSQNCWPSVDFDLGEVTNAFGRLFPAGFYYKTFMWPASFWEGVYEPMIRKVAGMGEGARERDPDHYDHHYGHCDVLVVGSGPAGLAAALAAGRSGARVLLAEQDTILGGSLLSESIGATRQIDGRPLGDWLDAAKAELEAPKPGAWHCSSTNP